MSQSLSSHGLEASPNREFWHFRSTLGALKTSFSFYITELYFVTKIPE